MQVLEPSSSAVAVLQEVVEEIAAKASAEIVAAESQHGDAEWPGGTAAATTTTTVETTTFYNPNGVTMNAIGDFDAFVSSLFTNVAALTGILCVFMVLRVHYPMMYSYNVLKGFAPSTPDVTSHFSWIKASLNATRQQHIDSIGLDNAMLLEFSMLAMKICAVVGIPMFCILGPMNCIFGGNAAGQDHLSYFSFGNIQFNHWLYWVHAVACWGVVLTVTYMTFKAQENFIRLRWTWLRGMAETRANTVLVEGIPEEHQSATKLRAFFETIFPGDKIKSSYCVRDTSALCTLLQQQDDAKHGLLEAQTMKEQHPDKAPVVKSWIFGAGVDAVEHYNAVIADLETKVKDMRKEINEASDKTGAPGYHCASGFVTFNNRSDAEVAQRLANISSDKREWVVGLPPEPSDVYWVDLMQDPTAQVGREFVGYLLVAGLYFAYVPLVIGITNVAKLIDMGPLQPVWAGVAPTFGLTFMVSFLPSFLIWIFKGFFTLNAEAWAQHKLQNWYFCFQMVFVVMATAVGQNVRDFTATLATRPFAIFGILADSLPSATHFYMNYVVLQWVTHSLNLLRYVNLSKFKTFSWAYDEAEAKKKSEPEDQDYYGIGSRSARWTTNMVVCLVYGSLCPPMYVLTFINFVTCRLFYGYLIPFAETRKPDLGGVFFVTQLRHLFHGMMIYTILMTGVLYHRAANIGPMLIVAPTIGYVFWALHHFDLHFSWEQLPFHEMMSDAGKALDKATTKRESTAEYVQVELLES